MTTCSILIKDIDHEHIHPTSIVYFFSFSYSWDARRQIAHEVAAEHFNLMDENQATNSLHSFCGGMTAMHSLEQKNTAVWIVAI